MSNSTPNKENQTVHVVLIIIVSMLLAVLVTSLYVKRNAQQPNSLEPLSSYNTSSIGNGSNGSDREIAQRLIQDSSTLANSLELKERALMQAVSEKDAAISARNSMTDQTVSLTNQLNDLQAAALQNSQLLEKMNMVQLEKERIEQLNNQYLTEITNLRNSDQSAELKAINANLEAESVNLTAQVSSLQARIQQLLSDSANSSANESTLLAFKKENEILKRQLADLQIKLNRSQLFVKEASSLSPRLSALYKSLENMKGLKGEALAQAYSTLEATLNVKKIRHVKFEEGSATVSSLEGSMIQGDLETASPQSLLLVVGYASTTGTADANYELSAKRATATATKTLDAKPDQMVKAVYLGQTDRFGNRPSDNQICEIWEVMP
ncbi:hypothetical protein OAB00_02015 [Akkermansiaceae bacterium]|nr:hypothetical protein [Akkermansiaceae bacterium]